MVNRILQRPPHPPSAPSPPEKARGEKALDVRESLKGAPNAGRDALQPSAFSPTFFVGEKVAEGRMRGRLTVAATLRKQQGRRRSTQRSRVDV